MMRAKMRISTEHKDVSLFDPIERAQRYFASLYDDTNRSKNRIPEEYQHYLTAFQANPTSAAARRMRMYLLRTGNGSTAAAMLNKSEQDACEELKRTRAAYTFYLVTENVQAGARALMAGTILDQTILNNEKYRTILSSLLQSAEKEYEELTQQAQHLENDIRIASDDVSKAELSTKLAKEKFDQSVEDIIKAESLVLEAVEDTTALENKAIKIVHPIKSIAEIRKLLTTPQTQAPDIYIVAGTDANGAIIYDKVTMGADGNITTEKVLEADAPALLKNNDSLVTDIFERVFHSENENGETEFVRNEHGFNGSVMGSTGAISKDMIDQYLAKTGKSAHDITESAKTFEKEFTELYGSIDEHYQACTLKSEHKDDYEEAKQRMSYAVKELESFRDGLAIILNKQDLSQEKIALLKGVINRTDQVIRIGEYYKSELGNGRFSTIEDILEEIPAELRAEFLNADVKNGVSIDAYRSARPQLSCSVGIKGPNPMNTAWEHASPKTAHNMNKKGAAPSYGAEKTHELTPKFG